MTNLERIRAMDYDVLFYFLFGDNTPCPVCPCHLCELECDDECVDHFKAFIFVNLPKKYKRKNWRLAAANFLTKSTAKEFSVFLQCFFDCCECCSLFKLHEEKPHFLNICFDEKGCQINIAKWLNSEYDENDWIQRFPDFML